MAVQEITKQVCVQNASNEVYSLIVWSEDQQTHIEASLNHEEMQALIRFYLGYTPAWEVTKVGYEVFDLMRQLEQIIQQETTRNGS